ncbi:hypothetical protein H5410_017849 [Solanum commersonii]|uniref:Uncharacterized protein n=1 Tax=Solanum commersonii TaxID=4109 RepID=A0A9J6A0F3_SOLCO|nr:hypothetical protein H5410_017849 [Solanum commersonii]
MFQVGLNEWRQSQPTSEDDSSNQSPDDDEASLLSKKIGGVKQASLDQSIASPLKQNEEEIDSLRIQVQELLKKQKTDRLRLLDWRI